MLRLENGAFAGPVPTSESGDQPAAWVPTVLSVQVFLVAVI